MDEFTQESKYLSQPSKNTIQKILNYSKSITFLKLASAEIPNQLKWIHKN